ncbi:hypothetical protein EDI_165780 [Entamoeba dispar SAW760]|uniref:Uncharacterized protein n=1 Tax=Entamoeba dispar (strain ATCC PRA-260 / SAW760) TaxID=370354 RepID=B0EJJ4_ENTDS|nr:uncharacterized protein EDI_165780 [Entamoeba dispar SAW760]EDR25316.1 hypothetical protein EDI_165780 [Entamoeba dispar SAW760]|eukprot:EDR25316.1 hypothetical protein EDI_165780 [Entamoeba dispar SAW760]
MSSTQTPGELETIRKYITPSLKEYKGFSVPDIQQSTPSNNKNKPHIITPSGEIVDINYIVNAKNVPHNLSAIPSRPQPDNYPTFEEYEAAWVEWKNKTEAFASYYRLPKPIGSELYIPSTSNLPLTKDPWDSILIPPEPSVVDFDSYESYRSAVERWIKEVSSAGFLPPHASEIEAALMVKMSTERKSDVAQLTEIMSAEYEGFHEDQLFSQTTDCFHISNCARQPVRKSFIDNSKFKDELRGALALSKLENIFVVPEKQFNEPQDVLVAQAVGISLMNILTRKTQNKEEKTAKDELLFKANKASSIFDVIVEAARLSEKNPNKCSLKKDENITIAINTVKNERPAFNAMYKLLFFPMSINDFNAVLDTSIEGRTIRDIFKECLNSPNIIWFFKFSLQTICPFTLAKLASFGKEVLLHYGKTPIAQFIIGNKELSMNEKLETLYAASRLVTYGSYDVFELHFDLIEQMKQLIPCGDTIEMIHMTYYLSLIANSTSKESNLKDLVKSSVTMLSQKDGDILKLFSDIPEAMKVPEIAPLAMFCLQQIIGMGDVQVMRYLQTLKRFTTTDVIQRIIKTEFYYSSYCAHLVLQKIMCTKDCRCQLLEQLTSRDSLSSFKLMINSRTPDEFIQMICQVVRFAIKECARITSNDAFWKGFTGDYFFADICLPMLKEAVDTDNEIFMKEIIGVIKTLLKQSLLNDKLGSNCTGTSDKFESLEVSSGSLDNIIQIVNKIVTDPTMKKYHNKTLFAHLIDCLKYIYSVQEQCELISDNKRLFVNVAISSSVRDMKEKIEPKLLNSILDMYATILRVLGQHPPKEPTPNQPLTSEEIAKQGQMQDFFDKLFTAVIRMKSKSSNTNKLWNYVSFYAKEASVYHCKIVLRFVFNLIQIAFTSQHKLLTDNIKRFLAETMFEETTALKMLMQQLGNTDITARDIMSYKKGYNCISYPSVMNVAGIISVYQINKKLVKKLGEGKNQYLDVVAETGKKAIDSKSLILSIEETNKIRKLFVCDNGKRIDSFIETTQKE